MKVVYLRPETNLANCHLSKILGKPLLFVALAEKNLWEYPLSKRHPLSFFGLLFLFLKNVEEGGSDPIRDIECK